MASFTLHKSLSLFFIPSSLCFIKNYNFFNWFQIAKLSGVVVTKLDGTAKGGVIFAIAKKLGLPIRFVGVGESIDDLGEFEPDAFIDALLGQTETSDNISNNAE